MKNVIKYLAIAIALVCSLTMYSQDAIWFGLNDNNWHNATNWSNNAVPTASTRVFINTTNPNFEPIVFPGFSADAQYVNINADRSLTIHGTLTITQTAAANFWMCEAFSEITASQWFLREQEELK